MRIESNRKRFRSSTFTDTFESSLLGLIFATSSPASGVRFSPADSTVYQPSRSAKHGPRTRVAHEI